MTKLLFITTLSVKRFLGNIRIGVIQLVSITLGLLIPFMTFAAISSVLAQMDTLMLKNSSKTVIYSFMAPSLDNNQIDYILSQENAKSIAALAPYKSASAIFHGEKQSLPVVLTTSGFFQFFAKPTVIAGNLEQYINQTTNQKFCIIEEGFLRNTGSALVGDNINIFDNDYTVAAIIQLYSYPSQIFVPYHHNPINQTLQQELYLEYDTFPRLDVLNLNMNTYIDNNSNAMFPSDITGARMASSYTDSLKADILKNSAVIILISLILLIYAAINIYLVSLGNLKLIQKQFAIKASLGATRKDIFVELLAQYTVMMLVSLGLLTAAVPMLQQNMPSTINFTFDAPTVLATAILGFLMNIVICNFLSRAIFKHSVTELIREA